MASDLKSVTLSKAGQPGAHRGHDLIPHLPESRDRARVTDPASRGASVWDSGAPDAGAELRSALGAGELEVHFQPQIDLASGQTTAVEALVRWPSRRFGPVPPVHLIPVAERTGLIEPITDLVLAQGLAVQQAAAARGFRLKVSVNVAAASLPRSRFVDRVADALREAGAPPWALTLEITESSIIEDPETAATALGALRSLGVGLALDDFGTGYSSLSRLHSLPFDQIKIDRSFVAEMRRTGDAGLVRLIIDMARRLEHRIVAEGAETRDDVLALAGMGAHAVQGFYFSPAIPADELLAWLEARRSAEDSERGKTSAGAGRPGGSQETLGHRIHKAFDVPIPPSATHEAAAATALAALAQELGGSLGAMWVVDDDAAVLRCFETWRGEGGRVEEWAEGTRKSVFARGVGLPGRAWDTGEPHALDIVNAEVFPRMDAAAGAGLREALAFPLWSDGRVVGVVELLGRELAPLNDTTRRTLRSVSRRLGQHVLRRAAEQHSEHVTRILERVAEATRAVARAEDIAGARAEICRAVCDVASADIVLLWHVTPDAHELEVVAAGGWDGPPRRVALQGESSGAATAFASGEAFFVPDVAHNAVPSPRLVEELGAASAFYEPVIGPRGSVGAFALAWHQPVARLDPTTRTAIALLATQASLAALAHGSPLMMPESWLRT